MTPTESTANSQIGLDDLDQSIVALLRVDGRMAFADVAKRLNIPEATARYRVQRLLQAGSIHITAWPNPEKLGTPHMLILNLSVDMGQLDAVAEELAHLEEVRFVAITAGRCNLIVDIYFGAHEELIQFFPKLHRIPGILSYESHLMIKLLKAEYKYILG